MTSVRKPRCPTSTPKHDGVRSSRDPNAAQERAVAADRHYEIGLTGPAGLFGGIETAISGFVLPHVDVDAWHCVARGPLTHTLGRRDSHGLPTVDDEPNPTDHLVLLRSVVS